MPSLEFKALNLFAFASLSSQDMWETFGQRGSALYNKLVYTKVKVKNKDWLISSFALQDENYRIKMNFDLPLESCNFKKLEFDANFKYCTLLQQFKSQNIS